MNGIRYLKIYNNILNIGKFYYKFLTNKLKKYNFLRNQDGFNISCCKLDDNQELYCVRYLGSVAAYFDEEIIPGNFSYYSKKFIDGKPTTKKISYGKNFMWNSWNETLLDNTIFFVASYENNNFKINENIEPYVISNKTAYTSINTTIALKYSDVRLFKINNDIYCYDGLISSIYQIKIINNKIYVPLNLDDDVYNTNYFYYNNKLCSTCDKPVNNENLGLVFEKKYDKNWSFILFKNNYFEFLNWFENGHVTITFIDKSSKCCYKRNIIKMEGDIIDGLGNNKLPMFSFGTAFININTDDKDIEFQGIAVGHTKIILTKLYDNENIKLLFNDINNLRLDESYIEHNSYIYMCYFIKLIKYKNNTYDMYISDSYLFIDKNQKYKFSIIFPMGLFEKNNSIVMSYGYGDYYTYLMEFNKEQLLKKITHNVKNFNINNYKFIIQ